MTEPRTILHYTTAEGSTTRNVRGDPMDLCDYTRGKFFPDVVVDPRETSFLKARAIMLEATKAKPR